MIMAAWLDGCTSASKLVCTTLYLLFVLHPLNKSSMAYSVRSLPQQFHLLSLHLPFLAYTYIYIDLSVNVYHSGPLERVIYSLSLVYHKREEDTWTSQDKMVYTLYLLSTYIFLGSSHLSSYLLPLFYIYNLN